MKKIFAMVLVVSLALNAAFAATWAVNRFTALAQAETGKEAEAGAKPEIWCPLHRELGVSKEQWQKIEPEMIAFHKETQKVCEEADNLRDGMIELLASSEVDREAVEAQQEKIMHVQRKMQDLALQHLLTEKQFLEPEQQQRLFEMLRIQSRCAGHAAHGRRGRGLMSPARGTRPQAETEKEAERSRP